MESLKIQIKIKDCDSLKESHDLLLELGFSTYSKESFDIWDNQPKPIWLKTNCFDNQLDKIDWSLTESKHDQKEITLLQLRDLVVLKRNSIDDANAFRHDNGVKYYITSDNKYYYFSNLLKFEWTESCNDIDYLEKHVKPIEKPMKEYLNPNQDYKLVTCNIGETPFPNNWIEIPEGAVKAYLNNSNTINFVNIDDDYMNSQTNGRWINTHRGQHEACGHVLVWQRKETLNDKVVSAETARQADKVLKEILEGGPNQKTVDAMKEADAIIGLKVEQDEKHSHYKKDVSHLDVIDIYRVTELFSPHACGAHIAKKALCSGQRGHKDLLTDIQDIIDTAERWKEMLIEDEKSSVTIEW